MEIEDKQSKTRFQTRAEKQSYKTMTVKMIQIDELWERVRETYSESSEKGKVHKDLIKPGTWKLIGERKDLKKKLNNTHSEILKHRIREEYTNKNVEVKKATKKDRQIFVEGMAEEAEKAAAEQRMRDLYQITRKLCGK